MVRIQNLFNATIDPVRGLTKDGCKPKTPCGMMGNEGRNPAIPHILKGSKENNIAVQSRVFACFWTAIRPQSSELRLPVCCGITLLG
jgi:hypothetical protein